MWKPKHGVVLRKTAFCAFAAELTQARASIPDLAWLARVVDLARNAFAHARHTSRHDPRVPHLHLYAHAHKRLELTRVNMRTSDIVMCSILVAKHPDLDAGSGLPLLTLTFTSPPFSTFLPNSATCMRALYILASCVVRPPPW